MTQPSDERLVKRAAAGDEHAFAQLYDRYAPRLLSFSRYLLGSRDEAQDAVQQTFMRAHRAFADGKAPSELRPWLYTVARNRCRSMLGARRERDLPVEHLDDAVATDGLADIVQRRDDLRALVRDLDRLPEDQRAALVLFELGDLSQRDIGDVLEVPEAKVKALVHQARTHLIAERAARERPCADVRAELAVARGSELRRGPLRRHVRSCPACRAWQADVGRQRAALGAVLPVALIGSREAALTALGVGAGSAAGVGAAAGGAGGIVAVVAKTGMATKVVAAVAALGIGAAGTEVAVQSIGDSESKRPVPRSAPVADRATPPEPPTRVPASAIATPAATENRGTARANAVHKRNAARKAAKAQKKLLARGERDARKVNRAIIKQARKDLKPARPAKGAGATKARKPKLTQARPTRAKRATTPAKAVKRKPAVTTPTATTPAPPGNANGLEKQLSE